MTQNLQLRAEVIDNATATLRKIAGDLNRLKTPPGLKNVREEFTGLEKAMRGVSMAGATVFSGIGLGSLSAGAAFAMLANRMKELANRTVLLQQVGRETGLLADQLKALQNLGSRFEIDPKAMLGGIQTFSDKMYDIRRGLGDTYGKLKDTMPGLAKQLREAPDLKTALGYAYGGLGSINDEQARKRWSRELFGTDDPARMFSEGLGKFREEWQKAQDAVGKEPKGLTESAKQFNQSLRDFSDAMDKFETRTAPRFLQQLAGIVEQTTKALKQIDELHQRAQGRDAGKVLGSDTGQTIGETFAKQKRLQDIDTELQRLRELPSTNGAAKGRTLLLEEERRKLQEALKEGAAAGIKDGIEKMSFMSGAGAAARVWNAAYGGGGGFRGPPLSGSGLPGRRAQGGDSPPPSGPNSPSGQTYRDGNEFYDSIIAAEGTAKRRNPYNEVLGYGRYGRPPKPLTEMTLAEVYKFGQEVIRPRHRAEMGGRGSSAAGAFQIVGTTMKQYMAEAGLGWNDLFTPENQRKLASVIAHEQGLGAWAGFQVHPRLRARAAAALGRGEDRNVAGGALQWPGGWEDRARRLGDMRRGDAFGSAVKLEGGARVDINLTGAGRGTRTSIDNTGIIKSVRLNRGSTMPVATDEE